MLTKGFGDQNGGMKEQRSLDAQHGLLMRVVDDEDFVVTDCIRRNFENACEEMHHLRSKRVFPPSTTASVFDACSIPTDDKTRSDSMEDGLSVKVRCQAALRAHPENW
ncbi:hypothetical protein [Burkholderia ubonensis]|uniref:hypothetical protein n=1 Tax=Burkholderia ubonensis TaxID=101571 RepID=UPI001160A5B5|nr:hypothetical protein [Burkholderia ubonensis]